MTKNGKAAARLWVFAPPHRLQGANARLTDATVVDYVVLGADGRWQAGEAALAELPRHRKLEIVLDGGDIYLTTVAAPKLAESKLRLALPNLLEDRLLAEPADCHFAFQAASGADSEPGAPPRLPVAVIDRALLTRLLDVLESTGARTRAAYSAVYLVPPPSGPLLSVHVARGRAVARTGPHEGVACDFDGGEVPAALRLALRQGGWQRLRAYGPQARQLADLAKDLDVPIEVAGNPLDADAQSSAINLLQGAFARGGLLGELPLPRLSARDWKAPIVWGLIGSAVFIAGMNVYWLKLSAEADELRGRMAGAFRSTFAEAEMVDPIVQAQRELTRLRARVGQSSAGDFSALNAQAAQLLAGAPVGVVASVEYRDATLQLKFKSPLNLPVQNQLRVQAVQQGLQLRFDADGHARLTAAGS